MGDRKTTKTKKTVGKQSLNALDPFDSIAEPVPTIAEDMPKRTKKAGKKAPATAVADTAKAVRKPRVRKAPKAVDAFAELAVSSPVKVDEEVLLELPAPTPIKKAARKKAVSSRKKTATQASIRAAVRDVTAAIAATEPEVELSPVFKVLSDVELPALPRQDRARLLMQSPTRLYFYWSMGQNPWQQLRAVFGADLGSYALVVKLSNLTEGTEEIHPIESKGEWWFNAVEPDCEYMAEIGFYATNRPYFRVLYSNTVTTPRRSPSPHPASEARWTVSATKFAEVLDASGFTRDAVEVAIAGDDPVTAEQTTHRAFAHMIDSTKSVCGNSAAELREAMFAIAGGSTPEDLRFNVSTSLFDVLQSNAGKITPTAAREALATHFDIDATEWSEHEFGPAVFGASLVNFPKTLKPRRVASRYKPMSSHSLGR